MKKLFAFLLLCCALTRAEDISAPVILQYFEGRYETIEERAADIFKSGYGMIYTPPPGRADQGNFSAGYDQYDRFELGGPGNYTLYGSETGLKFLIKTMHSAGMDFYLDYVINHNGYSDLSSKDGQNRTFFDAGGYPGMCISLPNAIDGDFHSGFNYGDINGRLAGLIDIDHGTNFRFYRNPVPGIVPGPNDGGNIRAGTIPAFGRLANIPDNNNRRFYPDRSLQPILVFDPITNEQNIAVYPFNLANPLNGTPVPENVTGYLMRNAQWYVQVIGADGFRLDAAKHVQGFALDYYDRSVYRTSFRKLLNGQQKHVFTWCEVFDGDQNYLQTFVVKTINPNDPGRIGGNRDTLDFPLFFALHDNLTNNGVVNSWFNIRNASFDLHDDGFHNGSQGVMFASSHDNFGADLGNVAHAYVLMHPGNAIVYFNAHEFGDAAARNFPKDGRGDALGGLYGNAIPGLVDIRNRYGRGNYVERWIEKENFAYERSKACLVLLSNRGDAGFDSRTLLTNFNPGTRLVELTGNAASSISNPFHDVPEVVTVNADKTVNVRFLRNKAPGTNNFTGNGYLIYGPATPQGALALTNVSSTLAGGTPTDATNGTTRINDIKVISADSFQVRLTTNAVNLLGSLRERDADGDNALLRIDEGMDLNGNGHVDFTAPGSVTYGFEEFVTTHTPGYFEASGNGLYVQSIDATKLSEGIHFITVRCFRHRTDGGPAVFTDFRQTIYIDRKKPVSASASFDPIVQGVNENRQLRVRSADFTANSVHVFIDQPAAKSDTQIIAMVGANNQAGKIDRDLFAYGFNQVSSGNHVFTVVTYERTGNVNVQRFSGHLTSTSIGAGLGDVNTDGQYTPADIDIFRTLLGSNDTQFHAAADFDGDGRVDGQDLALLGERLETVNASPSTKGAYDQLVSDLSPFNNPPVAVADSATTPEDVPLQIPAAMLLQNDSPGPGAEHVQAITVTGVSAASTQGGTLSLNNNVVTYTPPSQFSGTDAFSYTIKDNGTSNGTADPKSAVATVSVTVTEVNDAPTANPDSAATPRNIALNIMVSTLLANDSAGPQNEASQTRSITNVTANSAQNGSVVLNGGTITYTPPNNYMGPDYFTYTLSDNGTSGGAPDPKTATGTVSITVTDPASNQPPQTNPVTIATAEDTVKAVGAAALLVNDFPGPANESNQSLALTAVSAASVQGGTVTFANGTVTYTPPANFNGGDSFSVTVTDDGTPPMSASGIVIVTVTEVNDAPAPGNDSLTTSEGVSLTIPTTALLINDMRGPANEDGQLLQIVSVSTTSANGGAVELNGTAIKYTPPQFFFGADTFTYTAADNGTSAGADDPKSATATVTITVTEVNNAPAANPDTLTAQQNAPLQVSVGVLLANDTAGPANESSQSLAIQSVSANSAQGGMVVLENQTITYTPSANFSGADTFTYRLADNGLTGGTPDAKFSMGTVTVNVGAINEAPTAFPDNITASQNESTSVAAVTLTANDIPGPPSENNQTVIVTGVTAVSSQGGSVTLVAGMATYTPPAQFTGADSFSYSISDDGTSLNLPDPKSATGVVTVLVGPKNHAPIITLITAAPSAAFASETVTFTLAAADIDNDPLAVVWDFGDGSQGAGASATHVYAQIGNYTAVVTVSDGKGGEATGSVGVTVGASGFKVVKSSIRLNFKAGAKPSDSITLSGVLAVPAGYAFNAAQVQVNAGGVAQTFVLDSRGKAKNLNATLTIAKPKKGFSKFAVSFKKGSFAPALAVSGLLNETVRKKPVQVPASMQFNGHAFAANLALLYTARLNAGGSAK